jgi:putative restriction endonuclease
MPEQRWDTKVRLRAFQWLDEISPAYEEILPRKVLEVGFELDGQRIHLMSPQGIFTPKGCDYPLSITTVMNGPYPDRFEDAHRLSYRYRGDESERNHRDNVGLRNAMRNNVPLVYFFAVAQGRYQAIKPVYVTGDDPTRLIFTIMADTAGTFEEAIVVEVADPVRMELRRQYATAAVQVRLHQASFRERVLDAYRTHCAMCRLKHRELLDAAHIIPDSDPDGHPEVSNGLSLCKIHHTAFDRGILGVRPDYVIEVREDVLKEVDGPMLKYGLQALHNSELLLPSRTTDRP